MNSSKNGFQWFKKNKSKSKMSIFAVRSVISKRKLGHDIHDRLFKARLNSYETKKKEFLSKSVELNDAYVKCKEISNYVSLPLMEHFENVHNVVVRIVDKIFDMRTFPSRNSLKKENFYELEHKSTSQFTANIILEDIMVWSSNSPTEKVLSSIAGKLIDIHANLWEKIIYLIKKNTRLQELVLSVSDVDQNVNREIVSLLVENPPVDLKSIKTEQKMLLLEVMSNLDTLLNRFVKKHSDTIISRNNSQLLNLEGDGLHENTKWFLKHHNKTTRQIKKLEKKLIIVNEQLKIIDKEKGDLLDIIQKSQYTSQIDVVLLKLQKEKEKSAHLQSIVDDMYLSYANNRKHK